MRKCILAGGEVPGGENLGNNWCCQNPSDSSTEPVGRGLPRHKGIRENKLWVGPNSDACVRRHMQCLKPLTSKMAPREQHIHS